MTNDPVVMTQQAFAVLGGGKIAYVKPIRSEQVQGGLAMACSPLLNLLRENRSRPRTIPM